MYRHSNFFTVAALLVPVFLDSLSAACGPECIPSEDEGDMAAAITPCLLPDLQPPKFPDIK